MAQSRIIPSSILSNASSAFHGRVLGKHNHTAPFTKLPDALPNGHHEHVDGGDDNDLLQGDPVVISGIACRLPGGVKSPHDFWQMLMQKRSGQCQVPKERFNLQGFYHPNGDISGTMNTSGGYFLQEDVRNFENSFFGINNVEATYMDPQQRKLLEVVYECFESAGLRLEDVTGSNTGVYVGNFTVDFQTMQTRDPEHLHRYSATGSGSAILANRISHAFDLRGPSFTLDTACSASIYCLHNAVNAILNDECDAAIVAGANLITSPEQHLGTMKGGVLSPDSTCHTFDASANGYGRGEAVSAVYLTRVSAALGQGTPIRAVVRGTAVNANGRTPGITQPKVAGQREVIEKAYRNAGLDTSATNYVETHGTGTQVGDPMEVDALSHVFSKSDRPPLFIGANKPNVGHSEAASGIASIIKCVLAFEHEQIPPTMGIQCLNPKLKLEDWNIQIVTKPTLWPSSTLRASVNSFGYGGANAHAIVESFEKTARKYEMPSLTKPAPDSQKEFIFPFSGSSTKALRARIDDIGTRLRQGFSYDYDNLCYTLSKRRSKLSKLGYILSKPSTGAVDFSHHGLVEPQKEFLHLPLGFIFTGQGAQWPQMGKDLLDNSPTFSTAIDELDDILMTLDHAPTWTIKAELLKGAKSSSVSLASHSQPLCTAVQIGLVKVLRSWGITPSAVVGHSSGEIGAAYAAGLLTEAQAIAVAFYRGFAVSQITRNGSMLVIGLHFDEVDATITRLQLHGSVVIACVNSPESVTVSGDHDGILQIEAEFKARSAFVKRVQTGGRAYHSPHMAEVGKEYERLMSNAFASLPRPKNFPQEASAVQFFSSVGQHVEELGRFDRTKLSCLKPEYWRRNLENPVQFDQAVVNLLLHHACHMIEIGPHPALSSSVKSITARMPEHPSGTAYCTTLTRGKPAGESMKSLAGTLYFAGFDVDFMAVNSIPHPSASLSVLHDLPPYHWTYEKLLWSESRSSVELRNRQHIRHELLGAPIIAGNGIDSVWRNQFRLEEVPWMMDHKLESQIVVPAAAYIAMAMEAILRMKANDIDGDRRLTFLLREVNISTALVLSEKDTSLEIFTTMTPARLSQSSSSQRWCDFTISSVQGSQNTSHCTGCIRVDRQEGELSSSVQLDDSGFEQQYRMNAWYERLAQEGLDFGACFQSVKSLRTNTKAPSAAAVSTTNVCRQIPHASAGLLGTSFVMHPVVIDACLQAAIFGATGGVLKDLRACLPVFLGNLTIRTPTEEQINRDAAIHTHSQRTGFASKTIAASLKSHDSDLLIDMTDVRLSEYTGKQAMSQAEARHPCLRVIWKPDITRCTTKVVPALDRYIEDFISARPDFEDQLLVGRVGALLDLIGHKNARARILEVSSHHNSRTEEWLDMLHSTTDFPSFKAWSVGVFDDSGVLQLASTGRPGAPESSHKTEPYDVALLVNTGIGKRSLDYNQVIATLSARGIIITKTTMLARAVNPVNQQCRALDLRCGLSLLIKEPDHLSMDGRDVLILKPANSSQVVDLERELVAAAGQLPGLHHVHISTLPDLNEDEISEKTIVVSLLETTDQYLATMTQESMDALRQVTNVAREIIWVTGSSTLNGSYPDLTLANGLSRALMLEQPATRFTVLDIGEPKLLGGIEIAEMIHTIGSTLITNDHPNDKEFILRDRVLHISRFVPDRALNARFHQRLHRSPHASPLNDAIPAQLQIEKIGMFDTIYFQQYARGTAPVDLGHIEVDVKAVSLNAKDIYVLSGKVDTQKGTTAIEFSGIVRRVASDVSDFNEGDRVVVLAPNNFRTPETVPAWAAQKMLPDEKFDIMPTLPVIYGTALYTLDDRAHIRPGESILVHSGAGAFGYATLALAIMKGAIPYTTVSTEGKRDFLMQALGIPPDRIFNSRDESFAAGIMEATNGKGVDVIVNSLSGDLLHATWRCCAPFGRFVEVGKRDIVDGGRLSMSVFQKNVTFTAFDLTELYYHPDEYYRKIWATKFKEALDLYRQQKIQPVPVRTFDISQIAQAYRYFNTRDRIGKVVVSLENPASIVKSVPAQYSTCFDPNKSYLLVGCLGGLGRSLSKWMLSRGARHFSFLGRSGADKATAAELVRSLQDNGANVVVVRGDSASREDVDRLVETATKPVGGVVHAAMGLHESLFSSMTGDAWQTGIKPKWRGAWNLHHALHENDSNLDFFLMTSSVSGSVGTATESNYCAANGFLDAFARYRRSLGKPVVSVGLGMISEVGYLHENPEIESLLLRKGIQPLNEEEFLQVLDLAISHQSITEDFQYDTLAASHILTGLEPQGIRKMMALGFDVNNSTMKDARAILLASALDRDVDGNDVVEETQALDAAWSTGLPAHILKSLAPVSAESASIGEAILNAVSRSFSNLLLIPKDKVNVQQSLSAVGMDSMIAAEFRSWFFSAFQVDVPFLDIMSSNTTLKTLAKTVESNVQGQC